MHAPVLLENLERGYNLANIMRQEVNNKMN
jgi:hypothetical protein